MKLLKLKNTHELNKKFNMIKYKYLDYANPYFFTLNKRFSFEQTKEKQKRHFMLYYKFIDDMHYKRSKLQLLNLILLLKFLIETST